MTDEHRRRAASPAWTTIMRGRAHLRAHTVLGLGRRSNPGSQLPSFQARIARSWSRPLTARRPSLDGTIRAAAA